MEKNISAARTLFLKTIIFGSTGAVGRELLKYLLSSKKYIKITIIVRRKLDEWESLSESEKSMLNIIEIDSLDFLIYNLNYIEQLIPDINSYNSIFITLGSRVKKGEEEFKKVEYGYILQIYKICELYKIPHFSFCSSNKANKSSFFMLWQIKGETEEELKNKNSIPLISIFHPGLLLDRNNDERLGEGLVKFIPFCDKISTDKVGKAMFIRDIEFQENFKVETPEKNTCEIVNNEQMILLSEKILIL